MQSQDDKINDYLHGMKRNLVNIRKLLKRENTIETLKDGDTRGITIGTMINYFETSSEKINQSFQDDDLSGGTVKVIEKLQRELPDFIELLKSCEDIEVFAKKIIIKSNLLVSFLKDLPEQNKWRRN